MIANTEFVLRILVAPVPSSYLPRFLYQSLSWFRSIGPLKFLFPSLPARQHGYVLTKNRGASCRISDSLRTPGVRTRVATAASRGHATEGPDTWRELAL